MDKPLYSTKLTNIGYSRGELVIFNKLTLNGEIYELYCYDQIVQKYSDVKIVSRAFNRKLLTPIDFHYEFPSKIVYTSNNIDLGEFDILGLKDNTLYWWEITSGSASNAYKTKKKLKKKEELLSKLFPQLEIKLSLVLPESIKEFEQFNIEIIKKPNFEEYYFPTFTFNANLDNCLDVSILSELAKGYDYIDDVIKQSTLFFNANEIKFKSYLIERLYDLEHITESAFSYYDVEKNRFGKIEIIDDSIIKDGKIVKAIKATYQEIKLLRNRYLCDI